MLESLCSISDVYFHYCSFIAGQVKLAVHATRLCKIRGGSDCDDEVQSQTLVALLRLLEGQMAFNNIFLRHHLFCILQILAGRWEHPLCVFIFLHIKVTLHCDDDTSR